MLDKDKSETPKGQSAEEEKPPGYYNPKDPKARSGIDLASLGSLKGRNVSSPAFQRGESVRADNPLPRRRPASICIDP